MKFNLRITFNDGTDKEITASTPDLVAFEDKFNLSVAKLATEQRLGHLLFLGWHSEHRTKSTKLGYEEWLDTVSTIGSSDKDPK
jgi:hypothetical protein